MRAAAFFVFALLILLYSCTFRPPVDGTISNLPFDSSDGLRVSFLPGEPPDEVFLNDEFRISLDVENLGERTLRPENMKFYILGINPITFGFSNQLNDANSFALTGEEIAGGVLRGSTIVNNRLILGGRAIKTFSPVKYQGSAIISEQLFTLSLLSCYHYSSQTSFKVCLNKGVLRETISGRVCESEGVKQLTPSRSPVKIISAEQLPSSEAKIKVKLAVQNLGGGRVLYGEPNYILNTCVDAGRDKQDRVLIWGVLDEGGIDTKFDCMPQKIFLSPEGVGEVVCAADLPSNPGRGNYEVVAKFGLDYSYAQVTEKNIVVAGEGVGAETRPLRGERSTRESVLEEGDCPELGTGEGDTGSLEPPTEVGSGGRSGGGGAGRCF